MLTAVQNRSLLLLHCVYKALFHIQLITAYACYISEFTNQLVRFTVDIIRTDLLQGFIFAGILDYNPTDAPSMYLRLEALRFVEYHHMSSETAAFLSHLRFPVKG